MAGLEGSDLQKFMEAGPTLSKHGREQSGFGELVLGYLGWGEGEENPPVSHGEGGEVPEYSELWPLFI